LVLRYSHKPEQKTISQLKHLCNILVKWCKDIALSTTNPEINENKIINMKKVILTMLGFIAVLTVSAQTLLDTALNFVVKDTYGYNHELYDILNEGKIVVIDFFSTS